MNTSLDQLEILERDKRTFTHADPLLLKIIETEAERLEYAAQMIGRQWRGQFSKAHVLLIGKAYLLAKQGERDMES